MATEKVIWINLSRNILNCHSEILLISSPMLAVAWIQASIQKAAAYCLQGDYLPFGALFAC
jgi:hypothetical protein